MRPAFPRLAPPGSHPYDARRFFIDRGIMLTTIRGKAKSWIVKVLFGFLILAFGAWGIGDIFTNRGTGEPVLTVGDLSYSQGEFSRDLQRQLQQFRQQGLDLNPQQLAAFGGVDQILRQATGRLLMQQYADKLGLTVPLSVAVSEIQSTPQFHDAAGQFSRDRFLALLQQNNMGEAQYVEMLREETRQNQLMVPIFSTVVAPSVLVDPLYGYVAETRTADVLVIPDANMQVPDPDQAALEKSYQENIGNYQRPEYRSLVILHITADAFAKNVTIPDDKVAAEYEARKAEFSTPETRAVEQVVVQDAAKADAIVAAVKNGKSFADAVTEVTGGAPVDLGDVTKDKLPADIAEQSFALPADGVSDPLKSVFGLHVVHVKTITPGTTKTLDEVKDQLRQELALAQAGDEMVSVVNQLDDILAGGATVEDAATQLNLTATKVEAVDASGSDRAGVDAGLAPEILQLGFQTESGATSLVTTLSDGSFAVVQVANVTPAEPKPLIEVTELVKNDLLAKARADAADAKAKEFADKIKAGDLATLAGELGLTPKTTAMFNREQGDPDNGVEPQLAQALFAAKVGEAATGRTKDGAVVARLAAITPAKPAENKEQVEELSKRTAASIRSDLRASLLVALGQNFKIERNEAVIQQLLATEQ
jgi:peptidyl-prolyl cis-trans isomerase D